MSKPETPSAEGQGQTWRFTKSSIAAFEQCPRRLWLTMFRADELSTDVDSIQLKTGEQVGALARTLQGGIHIDTTDIGDALTRTAELVERSDRAIFEATFIHQGVLVRVDVMIPEAQESGVTWHVYEVKASTSVKPHHIHDLATQLWVLAGNGITIASGGIRHLNRDFVFRELGDYDDLFLDADVLEPAMDIAKSRQAVLSEAEAVIVADEPRRSTGRHCNEPHDCGFIEYCKSSEPPGPEWPIGELPKTGSRLADKWASQGVYDIGDLPEDAGLNEQHERIRRAVKSGRPFHDPIGFALEFDKCAYPHIWLDFETIAFAIPRWSGTKPFQQIPFQFSAHIVLADGSVDHIEALDLSGADPCEHLAELLARLPSEGTVFAWFKSAEATSLRTLAQRVPDYADQLESLVSRLVDPMVLTKAYFYHPLQRGSYSIKYVLPCVIPDLSYDGLSIGNGMMAQVAYLEAIDDACSPFRKKEIDQQLREYCGQDTWAMKLICDKLRSELE